MLRPVACCVLALALAAGSAEAAAADQPDSGVRGRVMYGPIPQCAVRDGDRECDRPYRATIRIRRSKHGPVVRRVHSNDEGRFRVRLWPGRYVLDPVNHGRYPHADRMTVRVRCGRFTRVRIHYTSGIR